MGCYHTVSWPRCGFDAADRSGGGDTAGLEYESNSTIKVILKQYMPILLQLAMGLDDEDVWIAHLDEDMMVGCAATAFCSAISLSYSFNITAHPLERIESIRNNVFEGSKRQGSPACVNNSSIAKVVRSRGECIQ